MATATLPKIGKNKALPDTPRGRFAQGVALRTGLNPWVIYWWTVAENNDDSVKRRPYNYLNFKSENGRGAVLGGVRSINCDAAKDGGCFPGFRNEQDSIAATVAFINHHFPQIRRAANRTPEGQATVIGHSGWGTSARTLLELLRHPPASLQDETPAHGIVAIGPGTAVVGAVEQTGENLAGGFGGLVSSITGFLSLLGMVFTLQFWLRVGQVVGGGVAILAGALILSRGELAGVAVGH